MSKKYIPSKKAYFNRPGNDMTEADWEAFKLVHPQPEYTGEICWRLHDSMLARNKANNDSAIVKTLLKELNINYDKTTKDLRITSDLTGKDIAVVEIEDDNLLIQLEQAGARVLYITSNVNYNWKAPEKYFTMYNDATYDATDCPAIDKRDLFKGKNIIVKYVNFFDYKKGLYRGKLYNIIKENNMSINKVLMNPPFDGSLHLEITKTTVSVIRSTNPKAEIVSIQPCSWLEDPLSEDKQISDYKKYKDNIIPLLSNLKVVLRNDANKLFNISSRCNLGIYVFNSNNTFNMPEPVGKSIFNKLKTFPALQDKLIYVKKDYSIPVVTHLLLNADGRVTDKLIVAEDGPIARRGYTLCDDAHGWAWLDLATDSTEKENLEQYLNSEFVKRIVKLANSGRTIYNYIPVPALDRKYSDKEYCEMFKLTEDEVEILFDETRWHIIAPEVF